MASSRSQEIRVGIITIVAVLALIGSFIWGKGGGFGVDDREVRISLPSAPGVEVGTPLTLNGVRMGNVTAVEAHPDEVRITAVVESSISLREDARAFLQMLEVTGGKKIEIEPGESSSPLPKGAVIKGSVQGDLTVMVNNAGEMVADTKLMMRRLDSTVMMLNSLIGSREFRGSIENTLLNLESSSEAARDITVNNRQAINSAINNFNALSSDLRTLVQEIRPTVNSALTSADQLTADVRRSIQRLDSILVHADTLIVRVDSIASDIRSGEGTVSMLLYDKEFAVELDTTIKTIRQLIENIDRSGLKTKLRIGFGE
jgi:phospholipid/cholesterol/gamma-HCH transport system substrate-binding protein